MAGAAAVAAVMLVLLLGTREARAAELVYWQNPLLNQIGVVNGDSSGAHLLDTTGAPLDALEGMSYDPVSNRLYVASTGLSANGNISYLNLDGGGGPLPLPAVFPAVKDPRGVVVDPVGRIAYWLNNTDATPEAILWARLDGSEGGELNLGGQPLLATERLTADPVSGRLYWGNDDGTFHYAPLIGREGTAGSLEVKGGGGGAAIAGLAVSQGSGQIFWAESEISAIFSGGISSTFKETVNVGTAPVNEPQGVAYDPALNRAYWANWGNEDVATNAIGFWGPASGLGGITPAVKVQLPQDVLVIKPPAAAAAIPQLTVVDGRLQCSQGTWGRDFVSSFVYQSPRSFSYGWTFNGSPIAGATESSFVPSISGSYACVVTATNQAGSTSQTSVPSAVKVTTTTKPGKTVIRVDSRPEQTPKPADLQLLGKARHLKASPGALLNLKVRTTNEGTTASKPANVCLKLTKGAKRALRAGKCRRLGSLGGGATATAKLRLQVKALANPGTYRLHIVLPGSQIKVTVRVVREPRSATSSAPRPPPIQLFFLSAIPT